MTPGRLYYLMGPSGAGKDSFLRAVRQRWGEHLLVAHRYITRAAGAGGENHIALSEAEFALRQAHGLFALSWQAHGLHYGLGIEIEQWCARGFDVLVNGSRAALPQARQRFGARLVPLLLEVTPELLVARLQARGRESQSEIAARLARTGFCVDVASADTVRLDNSGTLEETLAQFARCYGPVSEPL